MKNIFARGGIEFLAVLLGITMSFNVDEWKQDKEFVYSLSPAAKESRVTSSALCVVRHERLLGERADRAAAGEARAKRSSFISVAV